MEETSTTFGDWQCWKFDQEVVDLDEHDGKLAVALQSEKGPAVVVVDTASQERVSEHLIGHRGFGVTWQRGRLLVLAQRLHGQPTLYREINGQLEEWLRLDSGAFRARLSCTDRFLGVFGTTLRVYDRERKKKRNRPVLERAVPMSGTATRGCFGADDRLYVHGLAGGDVQELALASGELLRSFPTPWSKADDVSRGGRLLAVTGMGTMGGALIDLEDGSRRLDGDRFGDGTSHVQPPALSPDGLWAVTEGTAYRTDTSGQQRRLAGRPQRGDSCLSLGKADALLFEVHSFRTGTYAVLRVPLHS